MGVIDCLFLRGVCSLARGHVTRVQTGQFFQEEQDDIQTQVALQLPHPVNRHPTPPSPPPLQADKIHVLRQTWKCRV